MILTYEDWNKAIAEYCFIDGPNANRVVVNLSIDEVCLGKIKDRYFSGVDLHGKTPVESLVAALFEEYPDLTANKGLGILYFKEGERDSEKKYPLQIAFLALLVLAASKMEKDEKSRSSDYFTHINKLFECKNFKKGTPKWFHNKEHHQRLWQDLKSWIEDNLKKTIPLPKEKLSGPHCNVRLILSQSLLRKVDLQKLPLFFQWTGFNGGENPGIELLDNRLKIWLTHKTSYNPFTKHGQNVLEEKKRNENRYKSALIQIDGELEHWDGFVSEDETDVKKGGSKYTTAQLYLRDEGLNTFQVCYLFKRPEEVQEDDLLEFDELDDLSYMIEYEEIKEGSSKRISEFSQFFLKAEEVHPVLFMKRDEYGRFLSSNTFFIGDKVLALCTYKNIYVKTYLEQLNGGESLTPPKREKKGLPIGWEEICTFNIKTFPEKDLPPGIFGILHFPAGYRIKLQGGLKLGRQTWMAGAGPQVCFEGERLPQEITIDGHKVLVKDNVISAEYFNEPGVYILKAGGDFKRIEVKSIPEDCGYSHDFKNKLGLMFEYEENKNNIRPIIDKNSLSDKNFFGKAWEISGALVSGNINELPQLISRKRATSNRVRFHSLTPQERGKIWSKVYPLIINRKKNVRRNLYPTELLSEALKDPVLFALIKRSGYRPEKIRRIVKLLKLEIFQRVREKY